MNVYSLWAIEASFCLSTAESIDPPQSGNAFSQFNAERYQCTTYTSFISIQVKAGYLCYQETKLSLVIDPFALALRLCGHSRSLDFVLNLVGAKVPVDRSFEKPFLSGKSAFGNPLLKPNRQLKLE